MWIDAHAHLDKYEEALPTALEEIQQHSIFTVSVSMDLASYDRNREIARRCPWVLPTFGVHPWNAGQYAHQLDRLSPVLAQSPMLGEIGLDHYWVQDASQYSAQQAVLDFFLAAAKEQAKIVNLHTKGAEEEILVGLNRYALPRAIIHWYSGSMRIFHQLVDRGTYFTIGVEVLSSEPIKTIARAVPAELLLTETDNPGGMQWLTGRPGMPRMVQDVIQALAELRKTTPENITRTIQENFTRLTGNDPWLRDVFTRFFQ